jgi:hypothetical protein
MAKQKNRTTRSPAATAPNPFEEARDELFQHIMRCGVVGSDPEHQTEWFQETMQYMTDRYPELGEAQVAELRKLGERFAQPPKKRDDTAAA